MRLTPQSMFSTAQARCTAAADARLDSDILAAMLTASPRRLHSAPAASAAPKPPSLMSLSETPPAPTAAWASMSCERMNAFVGADRDRRRARERREAVHVGRIERLLQEQQPGLPGRGEIAPRRVMGEAAIGVGADRQVRPQRRAHGDGGGDLGCERLDADLELEEADARFAPRLRLRDILVGRRIADEPHGRNLAPDRAADEIDHGHACGAAGEIEQSHLHGGMRAGVAVERDLEALHQRGTHPGVFAHEQRREMLAHGGDESRDGVTGHGRRGRRLAPADRAVAGLDAHEDVSRMGHRLGRHLHGLGERQRHRESHRPGGS